MILMPEEHVKPLLRIITEERNGKPKKRTLELIKKRLHTEVQESYDIKTIKRVYKTQYRLYKALIFVEECGYQIDEGTRLFGVPNNQWMNFLEAAPVTADVVRDLLSMRISREDRKLWEDLFDHREVPTNSPSFKYETVGGKALMYWKPATGRNTTRSGGSTWTTQSTSRSHGHRFNPYNQEADSHHSQQLRDCEQRLRSISGLPSAAYVKAMKELVEGDKFYAGWLLRQDDLDILGWVGLNFPNEEFERFFDEWKKAYYGSSPCPQYVAETPLENQ